MPRVFIRSRRVYQHTAVQINHSRPPDTSMGNLVSCYFHFSLFTSTAHPGSLITPSLITSRVISLKTRTHVLLLLLIPQCRDDFSCVHFRCLNTQRAVISCPHSSYAGPNARAINYFKAKYRCSTSTMQSGHGGSRRRYHNDQRFAR